MILKKHLLLLFYFVLFAKVGISQDTTLTGEDRMLLTREKSGGLILHSEGWGGSFRIGKHLQYFLTRVYEFDYVSMKHPKEIKTLNPYFPNAKSYVYGKLNNFSVIRAGLGLQKLIFTKPVWGGVEVNYFYYAGLSLGLLRPVYLYIINIPPGTNEYKLTVEKYNPDKHYLDNIYGRGPLFKGYSEIKPHPGGYVKCGFNFEYATEEEKINMLEVGATLDLYPSSPPIMAFDVNKKYFFLNFYISYYYGKKKL